jgi:hypothetical protein
MSGTTGIAVGVFLTLLLLAVPQLWSRFMDDSASKAQHQAATPTPEPQAKSALAASDVTVDVDEPEQGQDSVEEGDPQPTAKRPKGAVAGKLPAPVPKTKNDGLTDADRELLARMGGGGADLQLPKGGAATRAPAAGPSLTAAQLMKVVQDNKPALQRCYETALRAAGKAEDTIKIKVEVTVGASGVVSAVRTVGQGIGDMNNCLTKSVRRWRFPASGGESAFEFPLVFQPGA